MVIFLYYDVVISLHFGLFFKSSQRSLGAWSLAGCSLCALALCWSESELLLLFNLLPKCVTDKRDMSGMLRQKSQQLQHATAVADMSTRDRDRETVGDLETDRLISTHSLHSPSKPSVAPHSSSSFCSCHTLKKMLYTGAMLLLALMLPGVIYYFVNDADIIDEHFDLTAMEALTVADKLSIRVQCPDNREQLQKFVAHYAICPYVLEIGVVATASCTTLVGIPFHYLKVSDREHEGVMECVGKEESFCFAC